MPKRHSHGRDVFMDSLVDQCTYLMEWLTTNWSEYMGQVTDKVTNELHTKTEQHRRKCPNMGIGCRATNDQHGTHAHTHTRSGKYQLLWHGVSLSTLVGSLTYLFAQYILSYWAKRQVRDQRLHSQCRGPGSDASFMVRMGKERIIHSL